MRWLLIKRFQIEDIVWQDASGVVFRAIDAETGNPVALRRFFPFGANGGGLEPDERAAYDIAVARLAGIRHPALRAVVTGGCDPVDGMPYLATEWIDGNTLGPLLREQPLPAQVAAELLTQALEVCELLSQVLAEEAVWVDTDPDTIILGSEESGRGFTFWISPFKWLGSDNQPRGLGSLVTLTESLLQWQDKIVADHAGLGLGSWLNWLRAAAPNTTLREARENLAAALGNEPPANVRQLLSEARPLPPPKRSSSKLLYIGVIGLVMVVVGVGGWLWTWQRARQISQSEVVENLMRELESQSRANGGSPTGDVNERAARLAREAAESWQGGVFQPDQGDLLARHEGAVASLEGVLRGIGESQSGKTLYLLFSQNSGRNEPRGTVPPHVSGEGLDRHSLEALVGSPIRVTGTVRVTRIGGLQRPEITITERAAIRPVDHQ